MENAQASSIFSISEISLKSAATVKNQKKSMRTFCFPEFCVNFATVFGVTAGSGSVISHVALEFLSIKRIIKDGLD
ncbi:hypothetical protein [Prevotella sp. Rep29]|uniref:hypothetical protein n=1 Tax=Prevotella sp. Rep29 TaxID=2691580 RepID=UPI001C6E37FE|nr:hypothetical protein [Prevotella sp. Rep29]QYR09902.1 hypothetical protein GRF55_01695 [Prevotella sp. Rep29]